MFNCNYQYRQDLWFPKMKDGYNGTYAHSQLSYIHQFSSVAQSCPTLCDPVDCSTPGFPVHHQFPEPTPTYIHCVSDAISSLLFSYYINNWKGLNHFLFSVV